MLGYGGIDYVYEVSGEASPVCLSQSGGQSFVVNLGNGSADAFLLFKAEVKKSTRQAVAGNMTVFGGGLNGAKGVIGVNIKQLSPGVYEITPVTALEKGEYLFTPKTAANLLSATTADVYAFGVD